jgi:uncharacterized coiled-coil DUF342 family protein
MEMPDVIYAKKKNGCDGEFYRATSNKYDGLRKMFEYNDKYHHDRVLEQLRKKLKSAEDALELRSTCYTQLIEACRENDTLRKERDELAEAVSRVSNGEKYLITDIKLADRILLERVTRNGDA